jgi:hypothetical protein
VEREVIRAWYGDRQEFGRLGNPQRWVNLLGCVDCPAGISVVGYDLNGTGRFPLQVGPTAFRLRSAGDFNVEIDAASLREGENRVLLDVVDLDGKQTEKEVVVTYHGGRKWPLPYRIRWPDVKGIASVVQVVDGLWECGRKGIRPLETHYDRLVCFGDMDWKNLEISVAFTLHGFDATPARMKWPSNGAGFGIATAWKGHHDWNDMYPRRGYLPFGVLAWYGTEQATTTLHMMSGSPAHHLQQLDRVDTRLQSGTPYVMRVTTRQRSCETSRYSLEILEADGGPSGIRRLQGDGFDGENQEGSVLLVAHNTSVTFGDVDVREIP